ncbi:MAG: shikimate kinase, partial [Verrucomicrobiaceae bacterium]
GCGYVGERVADILHAAGHDVVGVTHTAESALLLSRNKPYAVQTCDVGDELSVRTLSEKLAAKPCAVIHCASSNRGGAEVYRSVYLTGCRTLQRSFPAARILFTSSTSVYPQTDGSWVTEESDSTPDQETSRILGETENFVLEHQGCVARLAGIYGPGRSFVLKNFLEGGASIEGNDGDGRWLNQIHREDAASALAHLMIHSLEGIYNVTDDTPLTQRECFVKLAARFQKPMPQTAAPKTERKRAWTSKRVSDAKLRDSGWTPLYASYFDALDHDAALVPSILAMISYAPGTRREPVKAMNIVLIGMMGSGKTTLGRMVAQSLDFDFVDTDQLVIDAAGKSIPEIFATEGEPGFRQRESAVLQSLIDRKRHVIATGGGIVTQSVNLPVLKQLGCVVWLSADISVLYQRTAHNFDRPLLREADPVAKLRALHEARAPLYLKACDLKITTDDLSAQDAAYGVTESARVYFGSLP